MSDDVLGLRGKCVIISGAGQGIGRATAFLFGRLGSNVVVADVLRDKADEVAAQVRESGGEAVAAVADLTQKVDVEQAVKVGTDSYGGIDVCVNNMGGMGGFGGSILEMEREAWDIAIARNIHSTFFMTQACAKSMIDRGVKGAIVNVSSMSGLRGSVLSAPYGAAKAGVMHFTQTAALELAPHGIRVNCVGPASVNTENATRSQTPERVAEMAGSIPLGNRLTEPDEVAGAIAMLASDLAGFVTGQTIMCDGGLGATSARPGKRRESFAG